MFCFFYCTYSEFVLCTLLNWLTAAFFCTLIPFVQFSLWGTFVLHFQNISTAWHLSKTRPKILLCVYKRKCQGCSLLFSEECLPGKEGVWLCLYGCRIICLFQSKQPALYLPQGFLLSSMPQWWSTRWWSPLRTLPRPPPPTTSSLSWWASMGRVNVHGSKVSKGRPPSLSEQWVCISPNCIFTVGIR